MSRAHAGRLQPIAATIVCAGFLISCHSEGPIVTPRSHTATRVLATSDGSSPRSRKVITLDERFSDAFQRYIYGPTQFGHYGLPLELAILRDHGLHGVFFTESLFAARFGQGALQEIVGLIRDARQEMK